jgi:VWFA-related protein
MRSLVNFVLVPVVVRDASGQAVGNLKSEDFQIFDNKKQQTVAQFAIEKAEARGAPAIGEAGSFKKFVVPSRFTAILFDDVNLTTQNFPQIRDASMHRIAGGLAPSERIGIFTTSGRVELDFTDDQTKLTNAVNHLQPNPMPATQTRECPDISYEQANLILNRHDLGAKGEAIGEAMEQCGIKDPKMAEFVVISGSERALEIGDIVTRSILKAILGVVERLSSMPGQRNLVIVSPSFSISDREHTEYKLIDLAVKSHVAISALDARGVYTDDNSSSEPSVLGAFADGTGGFFFHNSNNIEEGIRRVSVGPEFIYVLGFSPTDLKYDGSFHSLRVKLVGKDKLTVNGREGYYAPKQQIESSQLESDEIKNAIFSKDEMQSLPVQLRTQFVQGDRPVAKVTILTQVDLHELPYQRTNGRKETNLRIVAAVFDRNGKYLNAIDRKVPVAWSDENAEVRTVAKYDVILDSGDYFIRLVVRDRQSQRIFAQNATIKIP